MWFTTKRDFIIRLNCKKNPTRHLVCWFKKYFILFSMPKAGWVILVKVDSKLGDFYYLFWKKYFILRTNFSTLLNNAISYKHKTCKFKWQEKSKVKLNFKWTTQTFFSRGWSNFVICTKNCNLKKYCWYTFSL